jgi:hypothetical protein
MMARVRATLRNLVTRVLDKGHDRYCPCGTLSDVEPDTVATRIVVPPEQAPCPGCGNCEGCRA